MNYNCKNTKDNNLYVAESDPLISNLDIDSITSGINRSLEDIKYGRCYDLETGMNKVKRMLFNE